MKIFIDNKDCFEKLNKLKRFKKKQQVFIVIISGDLTVDVL